MPSGLTDRGYRKALGVLRKLRSPAVYVGILQDKGSELAENGDITLAGYAAVNEFGTDPGGKGPRVPERSFMRSTVDENRATYQKRLNEACGAAIDTATKGGDGVAALEGKLGLLGIEVQGDIKNKIRDLREPPNAPSTLARKYPGDNPLIHTGRMRQSISFAVKMDGSKP
jgi:hypothetical protein